MRKLLLPALAAALVSAAAPALAGEVTIRVSSDGLDLTHAADIVAMKGRIDVAVGKACNKAGTAAGYSSLAVTECISDGTAKALAQLDARLADAS